MGVLDEVHCVGAVFWAGQKVFCLRCSPTMHRSKKNLAATLLVIESEVAARFGPLASL